MGPLIRHESYQLQLLYDLFFSTVPSRIADILLWKLAHNGLFTIDFSYKFLNFDGLRCPFQNTVSKTPSPKKAKVFLLLAAKNRLYIGEVLAGKGWNISTSCCFCGTNFESINHLFFSCSFVRSILSRPKSET